MSAQVGSRRERKRQDTRERIQAAAWALFLERGYEQTAVYEITEAVDVSERTFFRHFPNKAAVLAAVDEEFAVRCLDVFWREPAEEPPWRALRAAFCGAAPALEIQRDRILLRHEFLGRPRDSQEYLRAALDGLQKAV